MIKRLFTLGLIFAFSISFTACSTYNDFHDTFIKDGKEKKQVVKIGVFEPLSGNDKVFGELEFKGIKLAHEMFPTILGKNIELVIADNRSDINVAESVAKELVEKKVSVVLGSYGSANSIMAVKIFEEAKIPAIAITNTNPLVTSYNPYYFRACMLDTSQAEALTRYAIGNAMASKACVLRPEKDDYAMAMAQRFSNSFKRRMNGDETSVISVSYKNEAEDFRKELLKIKKSGANVIFLPESPEKAVKIIKEARKLGMKQAFLGTDQWDNEEFIDEAKNIGVGEVAFLTTFDPKTDITIMSEKFINAYKKKYGNDSEPEAAVALGFDAYLMAVEAINKARTEEEGEKIKDVLAATRAFPGASGAINLDTNGDPIKSVIVRSISADRRMTEHTIEPQFFNSLIENEGLDGNMQVLRK